MTQNKLLNIFIADDDEDDILFFRETIESLKIDSAITVFSHGIEACQYIKKSKLIPDIIFLDINMPMMNGIECLIEIRQNQKFNHVPILMYSTSAHERHLDESFSNGANLFIKKANSLPEQAAIIKKMMILFTQGKLLKTKRIDFEFNH